MFCARAIQASDGVVLILDGSTSSLRSPVEAPVLELEVMLAAACAKPVFVLDGSGGADPLRRLLGAEFFGGAAAAGSGVLPLRGASPAEKIMHLKEILAQTCAGHGAGAAVLAAHVGWEKLFLARPDRLVNTVDDGGNFPFAQSGIDVLGMTSDIDRLLERAEEAFKTDKMAGLVLAWDAIRILSNRPWGATQLESSMALLWLRALSIWGAAMAWLGLFGHSSSAALMTNLACLHIASRFDISATKEGSLIGRHKFLGGLASTYFSLSKLVKSTSIQEAIRAKGIGYANDALVHATGPRERAGVLAVRGPLLLSTRTKSGVIRGFWDLHASIRLNKKAGHGNLRDHGLAASRIQLGAAYKELAKYARNNQIALSKGRAQLEDAYEVLGDAHERCEDVDNGQLLMCMKHLIETRRLQGRESEAIDLWQKAELVAKTAGITDQLRQLADIARTAGWK